MGTVEHWDSAFAHQQTVPKGSDDPVGLDALTHFGSVEDKRLLDLGCGLGNYSAFFAERGATVTALDSSRIAIDTLTRYAGSHTLADLTPLHMSAFDIGHLGQFDLVFGTFILHHLEPFDRFVPILRSALVPGGRGFFWENKAVPPLMWARAHLVGRLGIPKLGDDDETPFEGREIEMLREHFDVTAEVAETYLLRLVPLYLLGNHFSKTAERLDARLHRFRPMRRYSYRQYVKLS